MARVKLEAMDLPFHKVIRELIDEVARIMHDKLKPKRKLRSWPERIAETAISS